MADMVFQLGTLLAVAGWAALAVATLAPRLRPAVWRATGLAVPALLALAYIVLVALSWGGAAGGFGSPAELRALFDTPGMLVAGWLHYLAFDLFVGTWIAREAAAARLPVLLVLPCLALTFLFGPAGFLLFLALRTVAARQQPAAAPSLAPSLAPSAATRG